eukprot:scaffold130866_cov42-Phaeocystis_antarctica.AAC.1
MRPRRSSRRRAPPSADHAAHASKPRAWLGLGLGSGLGSGLRLGLRLGLGLRVRARAGARARARAGARARVRVRARRRAPAERRGSSGALAPCCGATRRGRGAPG